MMLKKLQKRLDSNWIRDNNIWDIVIYGSYSRGKLDARDIDVAIILYKVAPSKKKMELCQQLRHALSEDGYLFDVKAVDIDDFLNAGFLGREAIFAEGISLIKGDYIAERFGFAAVALFEYTFNGLKQSKQKIFYYTLQGRSKGTGILNKLSGRIVSKGLLEVPTKNYEEVKDIFNQHNVKYRATFTLRYRRLY